MKRLYLFLLSSSVALACTATRVSAAVTIPQNKGTWGCDTSSCFSLTISGIGPVAGGDFKSPSGDWEIDDLFSALHFGSWLELQPHRGSVECMPTKNTVTLPWYSGFGRTKNGEYEADCRMDDLGGALRGWDIESCISYKVTNPYNPNTWHWTVTCYGSGPDWGKHCFDRNGNCPGVPEPSALLLVGIGMLGLPLLCRPAASRRPKN
jgi:hypothetical protein